MPFLEAIYGAGWPNGWREYDMESLAQLQGTLQSVGADTAAFLPFMEGGGAGDEALRASNEAAEAAGAVGVPHYVFHQADGRQLGLFGREHLALLRLKLHAEGLARTADVSPHLSHTWSPGM